MQEEITVTMDPTEQRIIVRGLADFRNSLIRDGKPTDVLDNTILKIATASPRRKRRAEREAR